MIEPYQTLAGVVAEAGFFTNGVEYRGTWQRTCVCSKQRPGGGLTGNSFWVTRLPSGWYLGTWSGQIYRLPDHARIGDVCISWLSRVPNGTRYDFDDQLKETFGLLPVSEAEFETEVGPG